MTGRWEISAGERADVVRDRIQALTPHELPERSPGQRPRAVIIGGQPGAGKSSAQKLVRDELGTGVALYDGDEFAESHPNYKEIVAQYPFDGHNIAGQHLPDDLYRRCMDHLRAGDTKYDVVASHPLGRADWAEGWVKGFSDEGYHVSVAFVATHESNSLLGIADRYQTARDQHGGGRWLPAQVHDRFYSEIPDVAHHLESRGLVDSMYVTNRDGDLLYENHRGPDGNMRHQLGARDTIVQERAREPTGEEIRGFGESTAYLRDPERLGPGQKAEPVHPLVADTAAEAERRHRGHRLESAGREGPPVSETTLPEALREAARRDAERADDPGRETPTRQNSPVQSPSPAPPAPESAPEHADDTPRAGADDLDAKLERIRRERRAREQAPDPDAVTERDVRRRRETSDDLGREVLEPER
ncbi:zeta toxin family protein [Nocardiopsis alborubida]|uniref:zeta toxin family protein n=1 Tax=Nocardiopsis alborubida TaxID=146802 RepID=UPI000B0794C8|nr:zeta toxin family protein [Nocardiopsis alborubida]